MKTFKAHIEEKLNEATAKVSDFVGHSHAKRAGIGVKVHMSSIGGRGDEVTLSHSDPAKLHKYADNHLGGEEQGVVVKHNGKTWSPKNEQKQLGELSPDVLDRARDKAQNKADRAYAIALKHPNAPVHPDARSKSDSPGEKRAQRASDIHNKRRWQAHKFNKAAGQAAARDNERNSNK